MSVTIKDVAKVAGVSHITVSRALNQNSNVKEETRNKIIEIAKAMNYVPNLNAKSLVLKRSFNIGLFLSSLRSGTSAEIFHELVSCVHEKMDPQYNIVIKGIDATDYIHNVSSQYYDGIILFSQRSSDIEFIKVVLDKKIPFFGINCEVENTNHIYFDEKAGGSMILEELLKAGHRKIMYLMGNKNSRPSQLRTEGYHAISKKYDVLIDETDYYYGNFDYEKAYNIVNDAIASKRFFDQGYTAICAQNDHMAIAALKALNNNNLTVPSHISVCGYDGTMVAEMSIPSITTVKRPIAEAVEIAVSNLNQQIQGREIRYGVKMMPKLIRRNSITKLDR